jgi:serine/threonine-protein kinase
MLGGRYRIVKELGQGGYGITYVAEDTNLPGNPYCVVKQFAFLSSDSSAMEIAQRLFENEAKILQKLPKHDQVPQILAYLAENNQRYLVQEYIEGDDLSKELIPGKQMPENQVIELLQQILQAVNFIHHHKIIHRDIKPSNLVRRKSDGQIVLIDFGAVKEFCHSQMLKQKTISIGSLGYMPPEQMAGEPEFNSDIYAVGMIGIYALTGKEPEYPPKNPFIWRDQNVNVSDELAEILDKMVHYDYNKRYSSAKDAMRDLEEVNNFETCPTIRFIPPTPFTNSRTITFPPPSNKLFWGSLCSVFVVFFVVAYIGVSSLLSAKEYVPDTPKPDEKFDTDVNKKPEKSSQQKEQIPIQQKEQTKTPEPNSTPETTKTIEPKQNINKTTINKQNNTLEQNQKTLPPCSEVIWGDCQ